MPIEEVQVLHPLNPHRGSYEFESLTKQNSKLTRYVFTNAYGKTTIDYANPDAVFELNKALLMDIYSLEHYSLPPGYLCPAIPGRAEYVCQLKTLLDERHGNGHSKVHYRVLDVGVGANTIYPIIASQLFGWKMVGIDIHKESVESARKIIEGNASLKGKIEILHQENNAHIFTGAIPEGAFFDATLCNPPFHSSQSNADKAALRKLTNLAKGKRPTPNPAPLNFGGKANELWCNGGEALFIKRMIKQSQLFKEQVGLFSTLVSKSENLTKLYKQLKKANASYETKAMNVGGKRSRILAWWF